MGQQQTLIQTFLFYALNVTLWNDAITVPLNAQKFDVWTCYHTFMQTEFNDIL